MRDTIQDRYLTQNQRQFLLTRITEHINCVALLMGGLEGEYAYGWYPVARDDDIDGVIFHYWDSNQIRIWVSNDL